ncbi:DUF4007 family protein [Xanthobacter sp. VNH20]|uniref:DUF4007 family protein n=1 Tax=Xanthobacter TaxID=279 RepID=UPI0032B3F398
MSDIHTFEAADLNGLRFSGHETFACRYAWLPKAYRAVKADPRTFVDDDKAMVVLGLGKNMVRALKFWVEVTGVARPVGRDRTLEITDFGEAIFNEEAGHDPYLEDVRTLWLLHWNIASRDEGPLFAWRFLLGHWPYPEFTHGEAFRAFRAQSVRMGFDHSDVTLRQHLDVFLHMYHPVRGASAAVEDSLDGPLVDLQLLVNLGARQSDGGRWETVYGFRREAKPEIGQTLFDYCLHDYWRRFAGTDPALNLRTVAMAPASPGQLFKLPEHDVRARVEGAPVSSASRGFTFQPSAIEGQLFRDGDGPSLDDVYAEEVGT